MRRVAQDGQGFGSSKYLLALRCQGKQQSPFRATQRSYTFSHNNSLPRVLL